MKMYNRYVQKVRQKQVGDQKNWLPHSSDEEARKREHPDFNPGFPSAIVAPGTPFQKRGPNDTIGNPSSDRRDPNHLPTRRFWLWISRRAYSFHRALQGSAHRRPASLFLYLLQHYERGTLQRL